MEGSGRGVTYSTVASLRLRGGTEETHEHFHSDNRLTDLRVNI